MRYVVRSPRAYGGLAHARCLPGTSGCHVWLSLVPGQPDVSFGRANPLAQGIGPTS